MPHDPARFTDEQRKVFRGVADLIRSNPQAFHAAGQWLDRGADIPKASARLAKLRRLYLQESRSRGPRGTKHDDDRGDTSAMDRAVYAATIRADRKEAARDPTRYEILQYAANSILREPPNHDALPPALSAQWACRVLMVAWILTDPRDLMTKPRVTRLQEWAWGEHQLEWLVSGIATDGDLDLDAPSEINRLYARTTLLDRHLEDWVKLVRDAMRVLEIPEPPHSEVKSIADAEAKGSSEGKLQKTASQLDETDWKIIYRSSEAKMRLRGPDLRVDVGETKGKESTRKLEALGILNRPHGKRGGYALTDFGRALVAMKPKIDPGSTQK